MDRNQDDTIVARDLLAAVGEVMLRWGYLETEMLEALGGAPRAPVVQRWLAMAGPDTGTVDEIMSAAAVRHLLAHGLCGIHARPATGGEAEVVCRDPDRGLVPITLSRVLAVAQSLEQLRLRIAAANRGRDSGRPAIS